MRCSTRHLQQGQHGRDDNTYDRRHLAHMSCARCCRLRLRREARARLGRAAAARTGAPNAPCPCANLPRSRRGRQGRWVRRTQRSHNMLVAQEGSLGRGPDLASLHCLPAQLNTEYKDKYVEKDAVRGSKTGEASGRPQHGMHMSVHACVRAVRTTTCMQGRLTCTPCPRAPHRSAWQAVRRQPGAAQRPHDAARGLHGKASMQMQGSSLPVFPCKNPLLSLAALRRCPLPACCLAMHTCNMAHMLTTTPCSCRPQPKGANNQRGKQRASVMPNVPFDGTTTYNTFYDEKVSGAGSCRRSALAP